MHEWNVDFEPRGKRGQPWLRVEAVRASDENAAIIKAASQENINAANYKARAVLVKPMVPEPTEAMMRAAKMALSPLDDFTEWLELNGEDVRAVFQAMYAALPAKA
ncbi:hypothetical protein [Chromobacterium haemolyticum]|uniref:hypothetical protein n=1 Tax=Chromobacterium haemolyticum TaxID=394935 RepID=UPI001315E4DF|nr:hypothetical protein [Chromobacterium haemolyticum]BBH12883.1 hypothetical protein CH06BL_21310 [Chromobacterium haemolyticum]